MFTSRQSTLRCDVVLFVERSGELLVWCEVKFYVRNGAEGKPSLNRAKKEYHAVDPKPSDLSMSRLKLE